jgi:hypothetical protein
LDRKRKRKKKKQIIRKKRKLNKCKLDKEMLQAPYEKAKSEREDVCLCLWARDFFDITTALFFVCVESKSTGTGHIPSTNEREERENFLYIFKKIIVLFPLQLHDTNNYYY